MAAIQTDNKRVFNRFLILHDGSLWSYTLELLAQVSTGQAQRKALDASREKLTGNDVLFFRHAYVGHRILGSYLLMTSYRLNDL